MIGAGPPSASVIEGSCARPKAWSNASGARLPPWSTLTGLVLSARPGLRHLGISDVSCPEGHAGLRLGRAPTPSSTEQPLGLQP